MKNFGENTSILVKLEAAEGNLSKRIQLFPLGQWNSKTKGVFSITEKLLKEVIANFNEGVRAGVSIDVRHEPEKGAAGWVKGLEFVEGKGLDAIIEWTSFGEQLLKDKIYKFISPAIDWIHEDKETGESFTNVLVGAGLTNKPFFKGLPALVASEKIAPLTLDENSVLFFSDAMQLKELIAKKQEELTADEKAFVVEHEKDLTKTQREDLAGLFDEDEAAKVKVEAEEKAKVDKDAKLKADEDAKNKADADAKAKADADKDKNTPSSLKADEVAVNRAEFDEMKANAAAGKLAHKKLVRAEIGAEVDKMVFSEENQEDGKLLPKVRTATIDFVESLNEKQHGQFQEIVKALPQNVSDMFDEKGKDGASATKNTNLTATDKIDTLAKELQTKNDKMTYAEALDQALADKPELADEYETQMFNEE